MGKIIFEIEKDLHRDRSRKNRQSHKNEGG